MRKAFVRVATTVVITLFVALLPARAGPIVDMPAPPLSGPELNGGSFDLAAWRGKTVIINFWASWCAPCRHEMPVLNAFYQRYRARGLEVIGISTDRPRDRNDAVKIMRAFTYPAAMMRDLTADGFGTPGRSP
jgi:thiol-disulfide isomerase/thioredoxin